MEKKYEREVIDLVPIKNETVEIINSQLSQILSGRIRELYEAIPMDWFNKSEKETRDFCYGQIDPNDKVKSSVYRTDSMLRVAFWAEFNLAVRDNRSMRMPNVWSKVVNESYFYDVIKNQKRLLWIVTAPIDYHVMKLEQAVMAEERLYEIANIPILVKICRCHYGCKCSAMVKKGNMGACSCDPECKCPAKYDAKLADVVFKAQQAIELRARGAIPQMIKNQNLNVTVEADSKKSNEIQKSVHETRDDLQRQIDEMRARLGK